MKPFLLSLLLGLFASSLACGADSTSPRSPADMAWEHLQSVVVVPGMYNPDGTMKRFETQCALEQANLAFRKEGLRFWNDFPDDPRRLDWFERTIQSPPHYWEDLSQGARARAAGTPWLAKVDPVPRQKWDVASLPLRSAYMKDAAPERLEKFRRMEYFRELISAGEQYDGHRPINQEKLVSEFLDLAALTPDSDEMAQLAKRLHPLIADNDVLEQAFVAALNETGAIALEELAAGWTQVRRLHQDPFTHEFATLAGKTISLPELKGQIVLVDFWSVHCSSCIAAIPHIKAVYEANHAKGFQVVMVCLLNGEKDEMRKVQSILAKAGVTDWVNAYVPAAEGQTFTRRYGVTFVPTSWLFDRSGHLITTDLSARGRLESNVARFVGLSPPATG